jgi:hypothetical protein
MTRTRLIGLTVGMMLQVSAASLALDAPVEKWKYGGCFASWCQTGWYSSPAIVDLDGDGRAEVVWGSYDLVVLEGETGALRWRGPKGRRTTWAGPRASGAATSMFRTERPGSVPTKREASGPWTGAGGASRFPTARQRARRPQIAERERFIERE